MQISAFWQRMETMEIDIVNGSGAWKSTVGKRAIYPWGKIEIGQAFLIAWDGNPKQLSNLRAMVSKRNKKAAMQYAVTPWSEHGKIEVERIA